MRKSLIYLLSIVLISFLFVGCEKDESFDEALLVGKWKSGTLFYKYLSNGSGSTWDTSDDVTEEEAQVFTWELDESDLTHIYVLEIGGVVPKVYTVTELSSTTLKYKDDFGKSFSFTRVED